MCEPGVGVLVIRGPVRPLPDLRGLDCAKLQYRAMGWGWSLSIARVQLAVRSRGCVAVERAVATNMWGFGLFLFKLHQAS